MFNKTKNLTNVCTLVNMDYKILQNFTLYVKFNVKYNQRVHVGNKSSCSKISNQRVH